MKRIEMFEMVKTAFNQDEDVILKLKNECDGKLPIPINKNDVVAIGILEFLNELYGEEITVRDQMEILQSAMWWTTTMGIL